MQIKRFSEQRDKYNKVLKISATIPATDKTPVLLLVILIDVLNGIRGSSIKLGFVKMMSSARTI